jgi:branched-chain amino acid transport system substrate-binding protein
MLRIKETPTMPEHYSLVSTSLRWGTTMYFLNDVFRPLNSWVLAGYENWYPFDMSCSVAMYISSGGLGVKSFRPEPLAAINRAVPFAADNGTGTNLIGALLPLTGDLADTGLSYQAAINQALSAITNTPGMPPIQLVIKDTRTDAATAYDQLVELRSNGCHIVLGPESSEECRILKTYANDNDVLLISSSSTATPLAIPGDNLMRMTIDDSNQARALAELLASDGISDIVILSRSDIYGEGFLTALIQEFNARGGTVFATNYCPRATDFIPEVVSNLATQVSARNALRGANRVGVVTILFDEGVDVLQQAASWPALYAVRWYGTDGMAQNRSLATNTLASAVASYVGYTCPAFGRFTNALYGAVEARISAQLGIPVVTRYPMSSYDALWLVARALKNTGGTNTMDQLVAAIRSVATNYEGCTGPIVFNDAGDRATGTYDMWSYRGAALGWVAGKVGPVVTVNQSGGPVTVPRGDEVAVAVKMYPPGNRLGMEADWWVAALTPAGWYYFGPDLNWYAENDYTQWRPVDQGALCDLNSTAVWRSATLPAGDYVFYFGVDERNGKVDDGIWVDAVQLSVR